MDASKANATASSKRRGTRSNRTQSKYGCFTCRARHVKCDERRPSCRRCEKANRVCEGFPGSAQPCAALYPLADANSPILKSAPCNHLSFPLHGGHKGDAARLSRFAYDIFARNPYTTLTGISKSIWRCLLPQAGYNNASVQAAAAAFGAAYEWHYLAHEANDKAQSAVGWYTSALKAIQKEIETLRNGPTPPLLACVLLACADLLHRRQYHALTHLEGAFQILSLQEQNPTYPASGDTISAWESAENHGMTCLSLDEELMFLFQCLDLQLASYSFTCPPHLAYARDVRIRLPAFTFNTAQEAHLRLLPVLNYCYEYIAQSRTHKYQPAVTRPQSLWVEEGRRVALLDQWLTRLQEQVFCMQAAVHGNDTVENTCFARILRVQAMSTAISVSVALNPRETAYDNHAQRFEQIIADAVAVLNQMRVTFQNPDHFSLGLGIAEPLFMTACKYRHSTLRCQAIDLLSGLGREGPWHGKLLAAVARRVVEIEEQEVTEGRRVLPGDISERMRVHSCRSMETRSANVVNVEFSRCRNVETTGDGITQNSAEELNWETWSETLKVH